MGPKTAAIAVYPISAFNTFNKSYWFGPAEKLLEQFPFLGHPHKHSFYMIIFLEDAIGEAVIDKKKIRLDEPKLICIKPNSVFSIDINRFAKGYILCFTDNFFSLRYNNNVLLHFSFLKPGVEEYIRLTVKQTKKWSSVIKHIHQEVSQDSIGKENVLRSYLNVLLYEFERNAFRPYHTTDKMNPKDEKMVLFEQLLEENYVRKRIPSFYASRLHISTNYLNRLCHEYRSTTAGELIRQRIVLEAQRLLHYTSLTVSEVAHKLGFDNPSYFVTFFKKYNGTTPEHFRRNPY